MKESLLQYLACPFCASQLSLTVAERAAGEVVTGGLLCARCRQGFAVRAGIPRFVELTAADAQRATAENFGAQWLEFDHVGAHHEQQFRDWIAPVTPDFVRGKVVLEGGCGKGRHTLLLSEWGARDVIGVDLSVAVEAAYRNTKDLPNVHIIQADIYRLPLRQAFDYACSVGVLHHLPDPRAGFTSLVKHVKPGGHISAWVYGRENNGWIVRFINPLRARVTAKLPARTLYVVAYLPTLFLYLMLKLIYAPLGGTGLRRWLFYADYLNYIARFPFREIHNIVHDHLTAPVAFYIKREEFAAWFTAAQFEGAKIEWHNRNSWRGFGQRRAARAEVQRAG